jgi:uncharacterized protein YycO
MKYESIRGSIKSGDLIALPHKGWGSWYDLQIQIVRMAQRSEYSHVGITWVIGERVFVIESVGSGVRIFPLSRLLPAYLLPLPDGVSWNAEAEAFAMEHVGDPYSKLQAMAGFLKSLNIGQDRSWQCAEFVIEVYKRMGLDLKASATPSSLVEAMQSVSPCYLLDSKT